jgi:hypothetical protein
MLAMPWHRGSTIPHRSSNLELFLSILSRPCLPDAAGCELSSCLAHLVDDMSFSKSGLENDSQWSIGYLGETGT